MENRKDVIKVTEQEIRDLLSHRGGNSRKVFRSIFAETAALYLEGSEAKLIRNLPWERVGLIPIRMEGRLVEIPIRGEKCKHYDVVDLKQYMSFVNDTGNWNCPLCGKKMSLELLYCESGVKEAINQVKKLEGTDDIILLYLKDKEKYVPINPTKLISELNKRSFELGLDMISLIPFPYPTKMNVLEIHEPSIVREKTKFKISVQITGGTALKGTKTFVSTLIFGDFESAILTMNELNNPSACFVLPVYGEKCGKITKNMMRNFAKSIGNTPLVLEFVSDEDEAAEFNKTLDEEGKKAIVLNGLELQAKHLEKAKKAIRKLPNTVQSELDLKGAFTTTLKNVFEEVENVNLLPGPKGFVVSAEINPTCLLNKETPGIHLSYVQGDSEVRAFLSYKALVKPNKFCVFSPEGCLLPSITTITTSSTDRFMVRIAMGLANVCFATMSEKTKEWVNAILSSRKTCHHLKSVPLILHVSDFNKEVLGKDGAEFIQEKEWEYSERINVYLLRDDIEHSKLKALCKHISRSFKDMLKSSLGRKKEILSRLIPDVSSNVNVIKEDYCIEGTEYILSFSC